MKKNNFFNFYTIAKIVCFSFIILTSAAVIIDAIKQGARI